MKARHKMHKAGGGSTFYAGGGSNVAKEAESVGASSATNNETAAESKAKAAFKPYKKGGKAMKHMKAEGAMSKARLDKPMRKHGGRVGSDKSPFSSAHKAD